MLKRTTALDLLQNVLWAMMMKTETCSNHFKEQVQSIILDIEPLLKTNKVCAIKDLRAWVNNKETIVLPYNLGKVMRDSLKDQGYTWLYDDKEAVVYESESSFGLKEAKDFVDLMEAVLAKTESKTF